LYRFRDVMFGDGIDLVEVGEGAGDAEDLIAGAR